MKHFKYELKLSELGLAKGECFAPSHHEVVGALDDIIKGSNGSVQSALVIAPHAQFQREHPNDYWTVVG